VLNDAAEARQTELWRLQGVERFADGGIEVTLPGGKHNMTDVAARVGLGQLPQLEAFNARRRELARLYFGQIDPALGLGLPLADFTQSNWHMFQVLLPEGADRGAFIAGMKSQGIGVGVHYPAMHLFRIFRELGWRKGQFPHAERIGASIVTLPLFPAMQDGDVTRVVAALESVLGGVAPRATRHAS
jgi:dTDP-4-amino-4,6-dideoxygalactose transaminase